MSLNKFVREYLHFTRKERIAVGMLLFILFLVFLTPVFKGLVTPLQPTQIDTGWVRAMAVLEENEHPSEKGLVGQEPPPVSFAKHSTNQSTSQPFYFNPNTISSIEWQKLGIPNKTISTIKNYLAKGGKFYKPVDLQKIYGIRGRDYERLAPFVQLIPKIEHSQVFSADTNGRRGKPFVRQSYTIVDINLADTSQFIALPGIGSKLAARIVNFREKLGGFYSIEQLGETYGLRDSVFQRIRPFLKLEQGVIKKIAINSVATDELKLHPYITWQAANAIVEYRNQHGPFRDLDDLKKIQALDQTTLSKLYRYLTL